MFGIVDMNASPAWVDFLNERGHTAAHWSSLGDIEALDQVIMSYAKERGAIVLTADLDFGELLAVSGDTGPSVLTIRMGDLRPETIGDRVAQTLTLCEQELTAGALVVIDPERRRLRLLPLREDT